VKADKLIVLHGLNEQEDDRDNDDVQSSPATLLCMPELEVCPALPATGAPIAAPQAGQNPAPSATCAPHFEQNAMSSISFSLNIFDDLQPLVVPQLE
jgi:hypothetical protein